MSNADMTRTALRNVPSAPSLLDQARKQARINDCVVGWVTEHGAQLAFPSDSATGSIWPVENLLDAELEVTVGGWRFEVLA